MTRNMFFAPPCASETGALLGRDFFAEDLLGFMAPKASHFFSGGSSKGMDIDGTICVRLENLGLALQPLLERIISPGDEHAL